MVTGGLPLGEEGLREARDPGVGSGGGGSVLPLTGSSEKADPPGSQLAILLLEYQVSGVKVMVGWWGPLTMVESECYGGQLIF